MPDLGERWRLWPDPDRGPWAIVTTWAEVDGRAECVGVTLRSYQQPENPWEASLPTRGTTRRPVTVRLLRSIRLGEMLDSIRGEMTTVAAFGPESDAQQSWSGDARYQRAAAIYTSATNTGAPVGEVARQMQVSRPAARMLVARARERGFLPPARGARPAG